MVLAARMSSAQITALDTENVKMATASARRSGLGKIALEEPVRTSATTTANVMKAIVFAKMVGRVKTVLNK